MPCNRNREPSPESTDEVKICWTSVKNWVDLSCCIGIVCGVVSCILIRFYMKDPGENKEKLAWALGLILALLVWVIPGFWSGAKRSGIRRDLSRRNTVIRAGTRSAARSATNLVRNSSTSFRNWIWREDLNRWGRTRVVEIRRSHDEPRRFTSDVTIRLGQDQQSSAVPYNISGHLDSGHRNVVAGTRSVIVSGFDYPGTPTMTRRENWTSHPNCPHSD